MPRMVFRLELDCKSVPTIGTGKRNGIACGCKVRTDRESTMKKAIFFLASDGNLYILANSWPTENEALGISRHEWQLVDLEVFLTPFREKDNHIPECHAGGAGIN